MKLILKLAWRNLFRNWRRSLITIIAVFFASFLAVGMRGMQIGTYDANIRNMVNIYNGYIQIQKLGYKENPSLNKSIKYDDKLIQSIKSVDGVEAYSRRIQSEGLIGFGSNTNGVLIAGIDPVNEAKTTSLSQKIMTVSMKSAILDISVPEHYREEIFRRFLKVSREKFADNSDAQKSSELIKNYLLMRDKTKIRNKILDSLSDSYSSLISDIEKFDSKYGLQIKTGRMVKPGYQDINEMVLGYKLMKNLKATIGDTVVGLSQGFDGSMGNMKFRIVGASKTGIDEFDRLSCFINIDAAEELFAMHNRATAVVVKIDALKNMPEIKNSLSDNLADTEYIVLDWTELMPDFKQSIEFDNITGILTLAILVIIVAFGILNTLLMSITERFREFGVMLSLGTSNGLLVRVVFFEMVFITIIGLFFGNIAAFGVNSWLAANPIELGGHYAEMMAETGFLPLMFSTTDFGVFFRPSILIFFVSFLTFIYPAFRLFHLEALKGIRYT